MNTIYIVAIALLSVGVRCQADSKPLPAEGALLASLLQNLDALAAAPFCCNQRIDNWKCVNPPADVRTDNVATFYGYLFERRPIGNVAMRYDAGLMTCRITDVRFTPPRRVTVYYDGQLSVVIDNGSRRATIHRKYHGGGFGPLPTSFLGIRGAVPLVASIRAAADRGRLDVTEAPGGTILTLPASLVSEDAATFRTVFVGGDLVEYQIMQGDKVSTRCVVRDWTEVGGARRPVVVDYHSDELVELLDRRRVSVSTCREYRLDFSDSSAPTALEVLGLARDALVLGYNGQELATAEHADNLIDQAWLACASAKDGSRIGLEGKQDREGLREEGATDPFEWPRITDWVPALLRQRMDLRNGEAFCSHFALAMLAKATGVSHTVAASLARSPAPTMSLAGILVEARAIGLGDLEVLEISDGTIPEFGAAAIAVTRSGDKGLHHAGVIVNRDGKECYWDMMGRNNWRSLREVLRPPATWYLVRKRVS